MRQKWTTAGNIRLRPPREARSPDYTDGTTQTADITVTVLSNKIDLDVDLTYNSPNISTDKGTAISISPVWTLPATDGITYSIAAATTGGPASDGLGDTISIDEATGTVTITDSAKVGNSGKYTVTATAGSTSPVYTDGSKKTVEITVTINPPTANGVTITGSTDGSATTDTTLQLSADVSLSDGTIDNDVDWSSNNDAIATVDSTGLISFKTAGDVTITATSKAAGTPKTASLTFNVIQSTLPRIEGEISYPKADITYGDGATYSVTVVTPITGTDPQYSVANTGGASDTEIAIDPITGIITVAADLAAGTYPTTAKVTTEDRSGEITHTFTITVKPAAITGTLTYPTNHSNILWSARHQFTIMER